MKKELAVRKLPTLAELVSENSPEQNKFMVLVNQPPPPAWVKAHPFVKVERTVNGEKVKVPLKYIPVERIYFLLDAIFDGQYRVEIIHQPSLIANSPTVCVRLHYIHPILKEWWFQDGVGSVPLQVDKDSGAIDFNKMKSTAVQIGIPSAESFAVKDAAQKIGKIFGRDLNSAEDIDFTVLMREEITVEKLQELYEMKKDGIPESEQKNIERIIANKEVASYKKVNNYLKEA